MPDDARYLLSRLRFRHLQMLSVLAETGGVRRAALRLNLTQPAVSKALTEIEDAFGYPLFVRTPKGLQPTAAGRVVLRGAALLVNEVGQLQTEAQVAGAEAEAHLRLGVAAFVAMTLVPQVLAELATRWRLRATIVEGAGNVQAGMLRRGDLDALITPFSPGFLAERRSGERAGEGALTWEALFTEPLAVIAAPDHELATRAPTNPPTWAELARADWILPGPGALIRQAVDEAFLRAGETPPVPRVQSIPAPTNVQLVAAGLGLSALPAAAMRDAQRAGRVMRLAVEPTMTLPPIALVYHRISAEHPRITRLRTAITTVLAARSEPQRPSRAMR